MSTPAQYHNNFVNGLSGGAVGGIIACGAIVAGGGAVAMGIAVFGSIVVMGGAMGIIAAAFLVPEGEAGGGGAGTAKEGEDGECTSGESGGDDSGSGESTAGNGSKGAGADPGVAANELDHGSQGDTGSSSQSGGNSFSEGGSSSSESGDAAGEPGGGMETTLHERSNDGTAGKQIGPSWTDSTDEPHEIPPNDPDDEHQ